MNFITTANRKHATPLAKGTGGINDCFKPSNEASKADLVEMHREDMKLKKAKRRAIQTTGFIPIRSTSNRYR